jgi:hypothetical protein
MKTALIATVVLTSLAGAAAAGMVVSTSTRTTRSVAAHESLAASLPQSSTAPAPELAAAASPVAAAAPPAPAAQSTAPSAPVEAARPPVPLRINHKRPLPDKPQASDKKADPDKKADADKQESADTPAGQMSQQTAKAAIEADGYKGVQMLNQGGNGVWKASALRGTTRVVVNVDAAGNVFTE